jgi:hypothetical protein
MLAMIKKARILRFMGDIGLISGSLGATSGQKKTG